MRPLLAAAIVLMIVIPASAQRRRAVAPQDDRVSIAFVVTDSSQASMTSAGSEAWLDLKTVSHIAGNKDPITHVRHHFGIRISRSSGQPSGTAVITAWLSSDDGRATIRVDGRTLTSTATVIDAHASVGSTTSHTLDIEVPASSPAGGMGSSIEWNVTTQ
jgi:hypothetical protein